MDIRNIAIIAHVDHGKTTLVDAMLKQTGSFRENQKEMGQELIMDSYDQERERGITILAKNTSVFYQGHKINIIDTPGHADFGGEVERTINMASGAILLVDAAEGPLPQTKFVLKKALEQKLKIILVINKIDKKDARPLEILHDVETLFLELAHTEEALHFTTLFAIGREGKAFRQLPEPYTPDTPGSLEPLFEAILEHVPVANVKGTEPFQMLISALDYDNYVGKLCIGKVSRGTLSKNDPIVVVDEHGTILGSYRATKLYTSEGLERREVETVTSGDIVAIAGVPQLTIGNTVCSPQKPEGLPTIVVEEPTIKISLSPNTSPFAGKEGKYTTSRQIKERLLKEREVNLGLRIEEQQDGVGFTVSGRGELHLSVLIEAMRREGFEMEIGKPQVIFKEVNGSMHEPYEEVTIDVPAEHMGAVQEEFGKRKATLIDMHTDTNNNTRMVFKISSHNLLGIRNVLLTSTRGTAVMSSFFLGYKPKGSRAQNLRNGALIATQTGEVLSYGVINAQDRGTLFVEVGEEVYEGQVVGVANKPMDIEVNVCKAKQLTNNRSSGEGVTEGVTPPTKLTLEQCLDFIEEDELLEVTPQSLRIRKKYLTEADRRKYRRQEKSA